MHKINGTKKPPTQKADGCLLYSGSLGQGQDPWSVKGDRKSFAVQKVYAWAVIVITDKLIIACRVVIEDDISEGWHRAASSQH